MGEAWGCRTAIVPLHLTVSSFYAGRGRTKILEPLLSVSYYFCKIGLTLTHVCNRALGT